MIIQNENENQNDTRITPVQKLFITFLARGLIIMSVICNVLFYKDFGVAYGIFGMLLDLSKIAVIIAFVIFSGDIQRNIVEVTGCLIAWVILTIISLGAAYGFLAQINENFEQKRLKSSRIYESHQQAVATAQQRVDSLSQYASLDTSLSGTIATLKGNVSTWEAKKSACPARWFTKCINPAQAKIDHFTEQLRVAQAKLDGYQSYQSALENKDTAMRAFAALDVSSTDAIHALFRDLGAAIGVAPIVVKSSFIILTAIMTELLGSFFMFLMNRFTPNELHLHTGFTHSAQPATQSPAKPLDTWLTHSAHNAHSVQPDNPQQPDQQPVTPLNTGLARNAHSVQNASEQKDFDNIVNALKSGELASASFNALKVFAGLNQKQSTYIRNRLVRDGYAQVGRGNELVLIK